MKIEITKMEQQQIMIAIEVRVAQLERSKNSSNDEDLKEIYVQRVQTYKTLANKIASQEIPNEALSKQTK